MLQEYCTDMTCETRNQEVILVGVLSPDKVGPEPTNSARSKEKRLDQNP